MKANFAVGDKVKVRVGRGWNYGTVAAITDKTAAVKVARKMPDGTFDYITINREISKVVLADGPNPTPSA